MNSILGSHGTPAQRWGCQHGETCQSKPAGVCVPVARFLSRLRPACSLPFFDDPGGGDHVLNAPPHLLGRGEGQPHTKRGAALKRGPVNAEMEEETTIAGQGPQPSRGTPGNGVAVPSVEIGRGNGRCLGATPPVPPVVGLGSPGARTHAHTQARHTRTAESSLRGTVRPIRVACLPRRQGRAPFPTLGREVCHG